MADAVGATTRSPLAEAAYRINSPVTYVDHQYAQKPRYEQIDPIHSQQEALATHHTGRSANPIVHNHASDTQAASSSRPPEADKRLSQASYASTSSSRSKKNYKTHIGPWQLGRTLGKGSSARVRLCRHNITNQLAAVKIVNRRMAYLVQDSSLAALSKWDSTLPNLPDGQMRVPMAIEREVAILKLIEHPNIMKLYDIWENRSEIYLILEYIDQGDLFTFINTKGRLSEEVAIYFFRQMISAIAYCHSFNVCHRDLKPENILITADLQLKIADFGMAALHQTSTHHLATACGSPHYAAPELLKNRQYRGDKADIWSMGVILYAMLSATLPFDDPDLRVMMNKTKKGYYEMPKGLSAEAENLIHRMLQTNPDRRITLDEIWRHPLVQRYNYIDDFGDLTAQLPETRNGFRYTPIPRHEIDPQLIRQLRSLWHMFTEQELAIKLSNNEPNDQKAFYWLLNNYRDKQLEDFTPELSHSMSDYHHLKPSIWKKRVSTCEFAQPRANGHGRSISRFTVISNAAENDTATVMSYDPYRASGKLKSLDSQVSHAKVIVHRDNLTSGPSTSQARLRSGSNARRNRANSTKGGRPTSSRGSLTSLQSSRQGTPQARPVPTLRHKRAVDFSHIRKRSNSTSKVATPIRVNGPASVVGASPGRKSQRPKSFTPNVPKLPDHINRPKAQNTQFSKNASLLFRDELRHFSNDIARNCDEAFRSSLMADDSELTEHGKKTRDSTPLSFSLDSPSISTEATEFSNKSWLQRPLPPLPADGGFDSLAPTATNSRPSSGECGSGSGSEYVIESATAQAVRQVDRRIVSAPMYNQVVKKAPALPSINENGGAGNNVYGDKARIVSAPPYTSAKKGNELNGSMEYLSKTEHTIRVVAPAEDAAPAQISGIKNRATKEEIGRKLHLQIGPQPERLEGPLSATSEPTSAGIRKMRSWFRRASKADTETSGSDSMEQTSPAVSSENTEPESATTVASDASFRRKAFNLPFWKNTRSREASIIAEGDAEDETAEPQANTKPSALTKKAPAGELRESGSAQRNIEVKQNWLTRLFRVKPATSYICLALPRRRARQEVAVLLRQWRRYGIRGVQVDKQRDIIFARIGTNNYLNIKEVAIAAEIVTVIEHGKKKELSIVRFTQERGAASSFHRVVDTMRDVFDARGLTVPDRRKQKMMIKTLTSANQ